MNKKLKETLVLTSISLILVLIVLFIKGFNEIRNYSDAFFVAGFIMLSIGGLVWVGNNGGFDSFSYSASYITGRATKYDGYHDYINEKKQIRSKKKLSFLKFIICASVLLFISFITYLFI